MDPAQAAETLAGALRRATDAGDRSSSWKRMMMGDPSAGSHLASALSKVASRMDPTEAARICGQAAKELAEALGRETDAGARSSLASALSKVAGRMDPTEAAKTLAEALCRETNAYARSSFASALSEAAGRMHPARPRASAARPPRHSPKHWAVRRMPMPARPWHRRCRRWRAGWTRRRPHVFAAMPCVCRSKRASQWPQRAGRGMILHSCQDSSGIWTREKQSADP